MIIVRYPVVLENQIRCITCLKNAGFAGIKLLVAARTINVQQNYQKPKEIAITAASSE